MHLRASRTLWLLGPFSGPQNPGHNGIVPQAVRPAHQETVKKVDCFLKTGRIFISFRAQIRLRMHLRASRTLWLLGPLSGPQTPGHNGIVPQAVRPAHQETVKKVDCFLKTGRFFISFRAQIRLRMHLRASRTLWLPRPLDPRPHWPCTRGAQPCTPKKGKNGKLFSQNNNFPSGITHLGLR